MPRVSNGRPLSSADARATKRKPFKSRSVNALAIAEQENPAKLKIRRSRLGESDGDRPTRSSRADDFEDGSAPASKRRKLQSAHDILSDEDAGSDSDGQHWHVGVDDDDDDSDLDSDDAMGESDEEKFASFAFQGSAKHKAGGKSTQLQRPMQGTKGLSIDVSEGHPDDSENMSESDDSLGEEGIDLATALDMNLEEEKAKSAKAKRIEARSDETYQHVDESGSEEPGSDADDTEESEEESMFSYSENDEEEATNNSRLRAFIGELEGQNVETNQRRKKPPFSSLPEQPSDHGLKPSTKLQVADLLQAVTDPRLRQSLKLLHNEEKAGPMRYKGGIPGKLEVPLAKRQQDRLDREVAYEKSKKTLNRWIDTVKQNRRADHISFPLPDPEALSALSTKQLIPTSQSTPLTSLESTIQSIMQESGLSSKKGQSEEDRILAHEELEEKRMPIEEVQARRAELRKARDLMFREEVRARRIKKIKSKAYRRVHRKERDKLAQEERAALAAAGVLDLDEDRGRNDRQRAEERMGARHRESRWAKEMKSTGRAAWDEDARLGVTDLAKKDEELRRRILGQRVAESGQSAEESSGSESDDDASSVESDGGEARGIERKLQGMDSTKDLLQPGSKLGSMAFMKKADALRRATNEAEIEQIRRSLAGEEGSTVDEEGAKSAGRMKFGIQQKLTTQTPSQRPAVGEFEERLSEEEPELGQNQREGSEEAEFASGSPPKAARPSNGVARQVPQVKPVLKNSQLAVPSNPWLSEPQKSKTIRTVDEPIISARPHTVADGRRMPMQMGKQQRMGPDSQNLQQTVLDMSSHSDSDEEPTTAQTTPPDRQTRNEDLVRMAFAGDDVFQDFDKEKRETIDDEGDQIIDNSLPGWGSWAGVGISKRAQKRAKNPPKTIVKGLKADRRKDAKLDRVIINEKRIKKNSRYLATEIPHPFESMQQYHRTLSYPLGPEWSTKKTFQDGTKPRVLLKQGVIRPMEKPLA